MQLVGVFPVRISSSLLPHFSKWALVTPLIERTLVAVFGWRIEVLVCVISVAYLIFICLAFQEHLFGTLY